MPELTDEGIRQVVALAGAVIVSAWADRFFCKLEAAWRERKKREGWE